MKKLFIGILLAVCSCWGVYAQDYSFSNHNNVPFSLNPSLVGGANAIRFGLNYRQQWPALGNKYHTVRFSYDQNFYKQMCSLGFAYSYDNMAAGTYQINDFDLIYSHTIRTTEHQFVRLGVQASLYANFLGDNFVFEDQYNPYYRTVTNETLENLESDSRVFLDFSAGASYVIDNTLTAGVAIYHIGEPKNGFLDKPDNLLHRKLVLHATYFHDLQYKNGLFSRDDLSSNYLFGTVNYQKQDVYQNLYVSVCALISPLLIGAAYRTDLDCIHTPSVTAGVQFGSFQANYVYDIFTSYKKKNGSWSHELNLIYVIRVKEKYPCPVVYW